MSILGQIQFRRDEAADWASLNPILLDGEMGVERDTDLFKIGDGSTPWNMLPYGGLRGLPGMDGRGIVSITRTAGNGAAGTTDTYTIEYTSGAPSTFTVTNGANGADGQSVAVRNEGTQLTAAATSINFVGGGVNATNTGGAVTVEIPADAVTSVFGRTGAVTAQQNDYDQFFTTPAEASAIAAGEVDAHEALADPHPQYTTTAEASAAASSAVAAHETLPDPHPQYLTQTEGDVRYQAAGQSAGPQFVSSVHAETQANTTVTPADLTGQVFTIPPGKTLQLKGLLLATGAAATTGIFYGFRVAQGAGANGNAQGSWRAEVALTSAAAATGLVDGDTINAAGGATVASGVLGTATVAGNNVAEIDLIVTNRSTNVNTTVALQFRSEVAGSAVTAQIGTAATGVIG